MKAWIVVLIFIFSLFIGWIVGYAYGLDIGYIEGSKVSFENCGFFYDPISNTYSYDIKNLNINWTLINNDTE